MVFDIKQIKETNAFSCIGCGKCTGTCPVARYSKTFSPRQILTHAVHDSHPDQYDSAQLWSCLTCQQCDEICPSNIKYIELIQLLRQFKGIEKREATCSHGGILESISKIMTTPDLQQDRLGWLNKDLHISKDSEYLYFTGCLPYFEAIFTDLEVKALNIARSTVKILNYFDIKPQVLANEKCCGHDFYWNGDMDNFRKLAQANLELIKQSNIKKIITSCPECYRTLKIDYPNYFGTQSYEVMHISEFIARKISEKNIELKSPDMRVTFQDPCRLGRHMKVYDAPREVLNHIKGVELKEMSHHHKRAICCGVSGWLNCSQISKNIQSQRLGEALATGADTLITSCVKCQIHFKCALLDKNLNQQIKINIKDLTELFAENLN
jgi:heterodisulfide reductase subunit D